MYWLQNAVFAWRNKSSRHGGLGIGRVPIWFIKVGSFLVPQEAARTAASNASIIGPLPFSRVLKNLSLRSIHST